MKEVKVLIKYKCLHHVSLTVTDLERAKKFYSKTLCLKEIQRPDFDFPGAWYEIEGHQLHLIVAPLHRRFVRIKAYPAEKVTLPLELRTTMTLLNG